MHALLKESKGLQKGGGERELLLTLDGVVLEVDGIEGGMEAMPVMEVVHVVCGAR